MQALHKLILTVKRVGLVGYGSETMERVFDRMNYRSLSLDMQQAKSPPSMILKQLARLVFAVKRLRPLPQSPA